MKHRLNIIFICYSMIFFHHQLYSSCEQKDAIEDTIEIDPDYEVIDHENLIFDDDHAENVKKPVKEIEQLNLQLLEGARENNYWKVKTALKLGAYVDYQHPNLKETAYHLILKHRPDQLQNDLIKSLLQRNDARIDLKNIYNETVYDLLNNKKKI